MAFIVSFTFTCYSRSTSIIYKYTTGYILFTFDLQTIYNPAAKRTGCAVDGNVLLQQKGFATLLLGHPSIGRALRWLTNKKCVIVT